jgi:glycosyltransferase involved in cell wall biosynthesis/GT2 family glycosyltransferase
MKIGILDQTCAGWSGGASYTRAILASLLATRANGQPLGPLDDTLHGPDQIAFLSREGKIEVPEEFQAIPFASIAGAAPAIHLDVVLPVRDEAVRDILAAKIGWIPDFQHCHLPELFALQDLAARDALFEVIAQKCQLVIVSSESSRRDFEKFLPLFAKKVRVLPFPSTLWNSPLSENPQEVLSRYHLPSKFALIANQFWRHKNHAILPPTLAILKDRGMAIPLVLTGMAADYRDIENRRLSEFFQDCARLGVRDQIYFLGHVPYGELVSLMRCSALVIQPSLFEGWNTTVEDAKALGRPVVCSNIPVHREQAPQALGFFATDSPEELASLLETHYPQHAEGPALSIEHDALARSKAHAARFGKALLALASEAVGPAPSPPAKPAEPPVASKPKVAPRAAKTVVDSKASWLNDYLAQKRSHLRFLYGKCAFQVDYWSHHPDQVRHLLYKGVTHGAARLQHSLFSEKIPFRGQDLGVLRQYSARSVQREKFPRQNGSPRPLPSIAIVTPSFNQGQTLNATIESVVGQAYSRLQYAVVDGGSTDATREVLERHRSRLAFSVSEPDDGQAHAIVKGFAMLRGDIMAYLNSDDLLMPGALSYVGNYFARNPSVDVIYGHRVVVDELGKEVGRWVLPRHDARAVRFFDYVPQETLFWRRSLYEKIGGINPTFQFAMDWDLLLRFMAAGAKIRRVPYFLACFRVHTSQKTHTLFDTVGEREKLRLLAREHPEGRDAKAVQKLHDSYRFRSNLCAILLGLGIRY